MLRVSLTYRHHVRQVAVSLRELSFGYSYAFVVYAAVMAFVSAVAHASSQHAMFHRQVDPDYRKGDYYARAPEPEGEVRQKA